MSKFSGARYLKSVYRPADLGDSLGEVAFVGRSNVGKSTILNAVCGKKDLAKTSQTPGRTRTVNVFEVVKDKWLVDLPGYGFAAGPKEDMPRFDTMLTDYLTGRPALKLVLLLVDAKVGATKLDQDMADWLQERALPFVVVANKCDRIAAAKLHECRKAVTLALKMNSEAVRWVSAEKNVGTTALANEISASLAL